MTSWSIKQVRAIAASAALPSVEADALAFHGSANASVELMVTYVRSRTEGRQTVVGSGLVLTIAWRDSLDRLRSGSLCLVR
jgi:hypothetical protein